MTCDNTRRAIKHSTPRMRCLTIVVVAFFMTTLVAGDSLADVESIPSYYSQLQYNLTSPSAYATSIGGFANPAVYGMMPDDEMIFAWSDKNNNFKSMEEWGFFLGGGALGLGVVNSRVPLGNGSTAGVQDWRLGLSGGNRNTTIGFGFGWSTGQNDDVGRTSIFQIGTVERFGRYASLGLTGHFGTKNGKNTGIFDFAVRPLGDQTLTLFADAELPTGVRAKDAPWSVGAMLEAVPGVQLTGRYFENESYALSLNFSFGGMNTAAQPRYDKDSNVTNTTYAVRVGYKQANVFDKYMKKDKSYMTVHLTGKVSHRGYRFFDQSNNPLHHLLVDLDHAKNDPQIRGVIVNISGASYTRGQAWEIREKLADLQEAGKHVVVFADQMKMQDFHLASVADRLVLDPQGIILVPGYAMGRTFVRDMLNKIGVGFDEWRFLTYKSAVESFSRTSMSEPDREQRLGLIEDLYTTVRTDVTSSRNVKPETFDDWVNKEILISPKRALELGMVDKLGRWEDIKDVIKDLEGEPKRYVRRDDINARKIPSTLWGEAPEIALVYGVGLCAMDSGIRARKLEKIFRRLRDDRNVKAVVFRVDSPGGDGMASDVVADAIARCAKKKPVIVSQADVAASGGYWISMTGTEIYSLPMTIVGSIGVIGGWVWDEGVGEKLGHTSDHVKVGDHADVGFGIRLLLAGPMLPERNLTPDEREEVITEMGSFYDDFVEKVAKARKRPVEDIEDVAQGRVFSGDDAIGAGLTDKIGGLQHAIMAAKTMSGLTDEEVNIVEYPKFPAFNLDFGARSFSFLGFGKVDEKDLDYTTHPEWTYIKSIMELPGRPLYLLPPDLYVQDR